ncbi:hypothetical protein CERZMDRAFT_82421 [Cercospora zeae-maydis SCOH1-5]|uniref:Uncharacterized protein n=1 Tax=Cercospora zeae-maydis SCOH1-5 TaxID=717836 RepID=A0A6A6FPK8_9PEZI|nr:hypothetical protein CERZMDRAFT_82421 [Cercospora zeae-maydis SCOH1-5]
MSSNATRNAPLPGRSAQCLPCSRKAACELAAERRWDCGSVHDTSAAEIPTLLPPRETCFSPVAGLGGIDHLGSYSRLLPAEAAVRLCGALSEDCGFKCETP